MKLLALSLLGSSLLACGGSSDACDPDAPNTICTIAGTGEQGRNTATRALEANLYVPQDTAISPEGEVWLLDFNNYLVRRLDGKGNIETMIGNGEVGDSPPPDVASMPAADATFNHTTDLFFHDGYLYLAAWHNSRIKRVDLATMMIENYAGAGKRTYYYGDEGDAFDAALDLPSSMALDPAGNLVIMDQANQVIRMVDQNHVIHRIAGTCVIDADAACAPGVQPTACSAVDPGSEKTTCGDPALTCDTFHPCTPGYGGDGGLALDARLGQPFGQQADPAGRLVYDSAGSLIFADTENHRIRKIDTSGVITTIAGTGVAGYAGDDGPADQAQISRPVDVAAAADGSIYFSDVYNNCIRKISPAGTISRVAGVCSPEICPVGGDCFAGDGGDPLLAKLNRPYGIELDGSKLVIADSYNNRIRVVNLVE